MKFGIVVLPGSNCDHDALHVTKDVLGAEAEVLWHKDTDLKGADCVIIPGGFAYGDYLRAGALAKFAPIMGAIKRHAEQGGLVFGICNGFQVLTEAGLLPGGDEDEIVGRDAVSEDVDGRAQAVDRDEVPCAKSCDSTSSTAKPFGNRLRT